MKTQKTHITKIAVGDTVIHKGEMLTVTKKDIKSSPLMGRTLFGDSYKLGFTSVIKVVSF